MDNLIKKDTLKTVTIGALFFELILAVTLPNNLHGIGDITAQFVDFISGIVPAVENMSRLSNFPKVTEIVFSVTWVLVLPLAGVFSYGFYRLVEPADMVRYRRYRIVGTLCVLFLLPTVLWALANLMGSDPIRLDSVLPGDVITRFASHSRVGLGITAWLVLVGAAAVIGLSVLWASVFPWVFR